MGSAEGKRGAFSCPFELKPEIQPMRIHTNPCRRGDTRATENGERSRQQAAQSRSSLGKAGHGNVSESQVSLRTGREPSARPSSPTPMLSPSPHTVRKNENCGRRSDLLFVCHACDSEAPLPVLRPLHSSNKGKPPRTGFPTLHNPRPHAGPRRVTLTAVGPSRSLQLLAPRTTRK